ncbi:MAG: AbrB/MazE/SpoVT family DNA-binding domain-containing protein [Candidatus Diapherotrites archaeon]|nr:AbrB/MazE/SpoVT family DNA-binding domain-containing protein [Candidatus Diapherotrites archaeon]
MVFVEVEVVVRRWGNSLGVTLPKGFVDKQRIKENERLVLGIQRETPPRVAGIFGLAPGWKIDAQKAKDNARGEDAARDKKISGFLRNH